MSEFNNSNIPILSGSNGHKAKAGGFQPMLLMRQVDEDGTVEPEKMVMTDKGPQGILGRSQYVTAEDLVEMVREMVKLEFYYALLFLNKDAANAYREATT